MRYTPLPNGIPAASVLGLGCAAMMGSASRRQSLAALAAAADAGINFFDTARSYGYGQCEGLLGEFLATRRDETVLCTKFGILPAPPSWKDRLKPLARTALRLAPSLRAAARRHSAPLLTANHFTIATLRESLHTSLRALRTGYVDILLLHAAPMSVLQQDDLLAELAALVDAGKVRLAGISGELDTIAATFAARPPVLKTAQFAVNLATLPVLPAAPAGMFLVANHPLGGPLGVAETRRRIAALHTSPSVPPELRAKLDPDDPQLLPDLLLNLILTGTGIDAIVPAMLNPAHLRANCRAIDASRFTPAELLHLRALLQTQEAARTSLAP
jgi:aryl-alcohol dehydrogenase-like predicted oxidoreductase